VSAFQARSLVYSQPGVYKARLTATDYYSRSDTATVAVKVVVG
jgi:PKD repeat protein